MKRKLKIIVYDTFFLLLPLGEVGWGLSSCRTHQSSESASTDSVAVEYVHRMDSLHCDFSFAFDSIRYVLLDDSEKVRTVVTIAGGRMTKALTKRAAEVQTDSVAARSASRSVPVGRTGGSWLWRAVLVALAVISGLALAIVLLRRARSCKSVFSTIIHSLHKCI